MFNKIILVGNLTRDIELRYSGNGMGIAKTALATSRKFSSNGEKKEEVCFIDITFFGRSAEIANQYLRKGSKILVEGRLTLEQWVDQNGQKRSKHSVTVENMQMLDSKGENSGGGAYMMEEPSYNAPSSYIPPMQSQPQSYQQPRQGGYNNPPRGNNAHQEAPRQNSAAYMPSKNEIPEIDIDDDEIPF